MTAKTIDSCETQALINITFVVPQLARDSVTKYYVYNVIQKKKLKEECVCVCVYRKELNHNHLYYVNRNNRKLINYYIFYQ